MRCGTPGQESRGGGRGEEMARDKLRVGCEKEINKTKVCSSLSLFYDTARKILLGRRYVHARLGEDVFVEGIFYVLKRVARSFGGVCTLAWHIGVHVCVDCWWWNKRGHIWSLERPNRGRQWMSELLGNGGAVKLLSVLQTTEIGG